MVELMAGFMTRYSKREKRLVLFALLTLLAVGIHGLLIMPWQARIDVLQADIEQAKTDLQWMASMLDRIPPGHQDAQPGFTGSLANLIDRTVKRQKLNSFLAQMTPKGETEIRIRFQAMPFHRLLNFIAIMNEQGLQVKDLRISDTGTPSRVDSSLMLHKV